MAAQADGKGSSARSPGVRKIRLPGVFVPGAAYCHVVMDWSRVNDNSLLVRLKKSIPRSIGDDVGPLEEQQAEGKAWNCNC
jgi:hypothetical protein